MKYIIDHGIGLEAEYPYLAEDSKCNHRKAEHSVSFPTNIKLKGAQNFNGPQGFITGPMLVFTTSLKCKADR